MKWQYIYCLTISLTVTSKSLMKIFAKIYPPEVHKTMVGSLVSLWIVHNLDGTSTVPSPTSYAVEVVILSQLFLPPTQQAKNYICKAERLNNLCELAQLKWGRGFPTRAFWLQNLCSYLLYTYYKPKTYTRDVYCTTFTKPFCIEDNVCFIFESLELSSWAKWCHSNKPPNFIDL